jgi:hypothetical protein
VYSGDARPDTQNWFLYSVASTNFEAMIMARVETGNFDLAHFMGMSF